jgi:hypothetical protein
VIAGWLEEIEREVVGCLTAPGELSLRDLADRLGVSERAAIGYVTLLASAGRLVIARVALPPGEPSHRPARRSRPSSPRRPAG